MIVLLLASACLMPDDVVRIYRDCKEAVMSRPCWIQEDDWSAAEENKAARDYDSIELEAYSPGLPSCGELMASCLRKAGWYSPVCRGNQKREKKNGRI